MSIVIHELKKIWNFRMSVVIIAICVLYFLIADISSILGSIRSATTNEINAEIVRRYGTVLTEEEMESLIKEFDATHTEWDLASWQIARMISPEFFEHECQLYKDAINSDDIFSFIAKKYEMLIYEATTQIKGNSVFAAQGILDYNDFINYISILYDYLEARWLYKEAEIILLSERQVNEIRKASHIWQIFYGPYMDFIGLKLSHLSLIEFIAEYYQNDIGIALQRRLDDLEQRELTDRQRQRLIDVLENGEYRGTMHGDIFWGVTDFFRHVAMMLIITSLVLHSVLITNDRTRNIAPLQYHTKIGRHIIDKQFVATLISSTILTTIFLIIATILFIWTGVFTYFDHKITSFLFSSAEFSIAVTFAPLSLGGYILIMTLVCYALCLGTCAGAFVLSRFSKKMISLIFKLVPTFVALQRLHTLVFPLRTYVSHVDRFTAPLTLWNNLYLQTGIAYLDIIIIVIFAITTLLIAAIVVKRDIVI